MRLSWGRLPHAPPARIIDLERDGDFPLAEEGQLLPYGLGRSYGDVCLNAGGTLLRTRGLSKVLAFDRHSGRLHVEAGATVGEILPLIVPAGWFLPVVPGTQFVTMGGAVANDVHGKNHHRDGSFGRFVRRLELLRSDGSRITCSPSENPDLFAATVGGLGLTGVIGSVEIDLLPVAGEGIVQRTTRFDTLGGFFEINAELAAKSHYTVAWVDAMHPSGRGIYFSGDHQSDGPLPAELPPVRQRVSIPFDAPGFLIGRASTRAFNSLYWRRLVAGRNESVIGFRPFFFPLDVIGNWNRLYGKRGFFQYQFVVPHADAFDIVATALDLVRDHRVTVPLAVLKSMGEFPPVGMLSFPMPGITLALDVANEGERTERFFTDLDTIIREAGGRLYPAKDARMTSEDFQRSYSRWREFSAYIDPAFSSSFWRRLTE